MRRAITPALRACAAAGALLALVTGCSADDSGKDAKAAAEKDAGKTATEAVRASVAKARGTSAHIHGEVLIAEGEGAFAVSVDGPFDLAKDKGKLAVDFPGGAIDHVDEIFDGDTIYVSGIQGAAKGTWGSVARDKAEAHYLLRAPLNDPEHYVRQIAAMRKVERFGSNETVGGTLTTRYRGSIDHATLTLRLADKTRKNAEKIRDAQGTDLPVFADAWVDRQGRLVRLKMAYRMNTLSVTTTVTLSEWGKPVKAAAPDASRTVPATTQGGVLLG
ncbi:hypothetical protein [Streptomyces sp. ME19-01-6]|uniref:hypothetical protein n=1 Tax=Streptomyces sp. ME19-01-6 TaxID=3028686 RepID=UPI0029B7FCD0|nr:hypothetical protein [Streptomyces sp. ME19-01-6]MDX3226443.1 hypothetical protein [Streptomyces sp. ME19-01-6]